MRKSLRAWCDGHLAVDVQKSDKKKMHIQKFDATLLSMNKPCVVKVDDHHVIDADSLDWASLRKLIYG